MSHSEGVSGHSVVGPVDGTLGGERLIGATEIRLSEIMSALSVALDITQGNPPGHCMRTALIGMRLAESLRLRAGESSALFYALLLKDLGCSSNAAKMAYLFAADDRAVKRSVRLIDWTRPGECFRNGWRMCAPGGSVVERLLRMAAMVRSGPEGARRISQIRCERGAEIARMLRLPEATARAILELDEHWDGRGAPRGLKGHEISRLARICCLAQTVEVFFTAQGLTAALDVAVERSGRWFDPDLVAALLALKGDEAFWSRLSSHDLPTELGRWEPEDSVLLADEAGLDRVAEAFSKVVDAKSPWTYEHSTRVAEISVGVAKQLGCSDAMQRDLRRAALLHDIGKLGVSNMILDKPEKPTPDEFAEIRKHPDYSLRISGASQGLRPAGRRGRGAPRTAGRPRLSSASRWQPVALGIARADRGRRVRGHVGPAALSQCADLGTDSRNLGGRRGQRCRPAVFRSPQTLARSQPDGIARRSPIARGRPPAVGTLNLAFARGKIIRLARL